ncbi:Leucine-rich repeat [Macleaya cordata]|uniref:Leucine-rich repeat n=1 Tax=Macleaya cordata TaxID=56857 RepID=A0A200R970_MACCD|nr:Leucine-rich repeat [Macleaya cordata]
MQPRTDDYIYSSTLIRSDRSNNLTIMINFELKNIQSFHLLVLVLLLFFAQFPISHCCHEDERAALLSFKSFLTDPSNRLSSWQVGAQNCCNWYGIQCSHDSFHVVSVDLHSPSSTALNGTISLSLFNLTHLQYLDLSFNDFQFSKIPHQFANLKHLTYLNLSNSMFSGSITTQFANLSSLQYLDISCSFYSSSSNVSSIDVSWLRGLVNLKMLSLSGVDLSVASSSTMNWAEPISFLSELKQLDLSDCSISSPVPIYEFLSNLSHLSSLRMGFNFLNSSIPIQLANLTSLSVLDLTDCQFQGSISYLPQLQELYVDRNDNLIVNLTWMFDHQWPKLHTLSVQSTKVFGPIPDSISNASSLVALDASFCSIQGSLPFSISNLSRLEYLDLSFNSNLTGYLPSSISNLKNLRYLDLSNNNLQGLIPESICKIPFLQLLHLTSNNISGTIPSCITKLQNLYMFDVSSNSIGGTVPLISLINNLNLTSIDLSLNRITVEIDQYSLPLKFQLSVLRLGSCNLKGYFPAFICNLTELFILDLSRNNLTGFIPSCLFKLPNINYLDLSRNNFQGTLPHSLSSQVVRFFDLSHNKIIGKISTEIGEILSNIRGVSLSGNKLSGSIPFSICSKKSVLGRLDLSNNSLSGTIPSTLEYCTSLYFLNLGMNNLTGHIPNELERATNLAYLQLYDNNLNGTFPSYIQQLQNLEVLNLGNNNFGGSIPTVIGSLQNLKILSLRSNKFNGSIPKEINHLSKLQFLDLSTNNLSGLIPTKMGNLEMLTSRPNNKVLVGDSITLDRNSGVRLEIVNKGIIQYLETVYSYNSGIDLSCNILEGPIPEEMSLLKGLAMLNLSHNRLSDKIPMTVGNMTSLESLDLSFNNLSGDIPQSLTWIDSLGTLNLSYNNLSGSIPTGPHFDTLSGDGDSAYIGNEFLCGIHSRKSCEGDPNISTDPNLLNDEDEDEDEEDAREKWLFYGVVALGFIVGFWGLFLVLLLRKEKWWFGYWRVVDTIAARILRGVKMVEPGFHGLKVSGLGQRSEVRAHYG